MPKANQAPPAEPTAEELAAAQAATDQAAADAEAAAKAAADAQAAADAEAAAKAAADAQAAADAEAAAKAAAQVDWPKTMRIVNNTAQPLSFPAVNANVTPYGGIADVTLNTHDEELRLRTDMAQLAELHRWSESAIEITLL